MSVRDDPYHDVKTYHMAGKVHRVTGRVTALCSKARRPTPLRWERGQAWTIRWEAVTCKRCLALRHTA